MAEVCGSSQHLPTLSKKLGTQNWESKAMPKIAFTFDDDPSLLETDKGVSSTKELLRVIAELNRELGLDDRSRIRVTFFIQGNYARLQTDLLKRIHNEGHELGNHSYSHKNFYDLTLDAIVEDVGRTHELIHKAIGQEPIYLRPPFGHLTQEMKDKIRSKFPNYQFVSWHQHYEDKNSPSETIEQKIVNGAFDNQVVLAHSWKTQTLFAMRDTFKTLHQRGYQFVTVRQLDRLPKPLFKDRLGTWKAVA
jgi:peptidoglycan-N-acetylglucosamine deacetylase